MAHLESAKQQLKRAVQADRNIRNYDVTSPPYTTLYWYLLDDCGVDSHVIL